MGRTTRFCTKCGAALGVEHRFCGHCGEPGSAAAAGSRTAARPLARPEGVRLPEPSQLASSTDNTTAATARTHVKYAIQTLLAGLCALALLSAELGIVRVQLGSGRTRIFVLIATLCFLAYFFLVVFAWLRFIARGRDLLKGL